jgi:hypothetical protein
MYLKAGKPKMKGPLSAEDLLTKSSRGRRWKGKKERETKFIASSPFISAIIKGTQASATFMT